MPTHAFSETLTFTRCQNWDTDECPHLQNPNMQLTLINHPNWILLNDQTLESLNRLCDGCMGLQTK
jgi:hypothetical protein